MFVKQRFVYIYKCVCVCVFVFDKVAPRILIIRILGSTVLAHNILRKCAKISVSRIDPPNKDFSDNLYFFYYKKKRAFQGCYREAVSRGSPPKTECP